MHHELPNDLRLSMLGNKERSGKSQNFIELLPTAQSFSQNENLVRTSKNLLKKRKLNFSRSALFHMENRVCVKYFVNDCRLGMLGGGKKTHIIFSSTLTVQSRLLFDPKKQGNCKWLAKKVKMPKRCRENARGASASF